MMCPFDLSHYFLHLATMFCICSEPLGAKEFGLQLTSLVSWYQEAMNEAAKYRTNEKDT